MAEDDNNTKVFNAQKYYPITTRPIMDRTPDAQAGWTGAQKLQAGIDGATGNLNNAVINRPNAYVDAAAGYANNLEMVVSFYHVPSGKSVYFKAFITAFNETYSCDWGREAVFGRIDPIYMFKQTDKRISLALAVPAASDSEDYENLGKVQMLSQFLYPAYTNIESATTIAQSPLIRIKVMNLLQSTTGQADSEASPWDLMTSYTSKPDASAGQLGVINSLSVNHNLDRADAGVIERGPNTILPKHIELNLEFSPIHESPLGWQDGESKNQLFPYGVSLSSGEIKKDQQGNPIIAAATPPPDASEGGWDPTTQYDAEGNRIAGPGQPNKPLQSENAPTGHDAQVALHMAMANSRASNVGYNAAQSYTHAYGPWGQLRDAGATKEYDMDAINAINKAVGAPVVDPAD